MKMFNLFSAAASGLVLMLAGLAPANAQTYPARPIRIIVPAAPGAATDLVPRVIAAKLNERLGWNVVTENRPGGNFLIGTRAVLQADADGHTILAAVGTLAILAASGKGGGIDFLKELAPVTRTVNLQLALISNPAAPYKTFAEMVSYAKANPGKLSYGSAGTGTATHLSFEMVKELAGIDVVIIPYKDGSFTPDVVAGVVPLGVTSVSSVSPFVNSGKVLALAIMGAKRSPILPNVPTVGEAGGFAAVDADPWLGFMFRAGTPGDIINRLNQEVVAVLQLPDVREQMLKLGAIPAGERPEDFRKKFEGDVERWAKVIRSANIKIE